MCLATWGWCYANSHGASTMFFFVKQPKPKMDSQVRFRSTKVNKPVNKINKINQLNKSIEKAHRHLVLLYVLL